MNYTDYLYITANYATSTATASFAIAAKITVVITTVTGISTLLIGVAAVPPSLAFSGSWCLSFLGAMTATTICKKITSDATHFVLIKSLGYHGEQIADIIDIGFAIWSHGYRNEAAQILINAAQLNNVKFLGNIDGLFYSVKGKLDKYINIHADNNIKKYGYTESIEYIEIFQNSDSTIIETLNYALKNGLDNGCFMIGSTTIGVIIDYFLYEKSYKNPPPLDSDIGNKCVVKHYTVNTHNQCIVKHGLSEVKFECKENQEYTGYFECEELIDHEYNSIDAEIYDH